MSRSRSRYRERTRYGYSGGGLAFSSQLADFRTARDDIDNNPVDVVMFGNSITMGGFSINQGGVYGGFPGMVGDLLTTTYGPNSTHGPGWVPCRLSGSYPQWSLTNTSGNSAQDLTHGAGRWAVDLRQGDILTLAAADAFAGDRYIVAYTQASGKGTLQFDVDDTEDFSVATANATEKSHIMVSSDPYTLGNHKLELIAASGDVIVDGVFICRGNHDAGFRVWNCGHSGDDYTNLTSNTHTMDILDTLDPVLTWNQLFFNERGTSNYLLGQFLLALAQDAIQTPNDRVWAFEYETALWTVDGNYDEMVADGTGFANTAGDAYYNVGAHLRSTGSLGFDGVSNDPCDYLRTDNAHPELAGNQAIAAGIANFLSDAPNPVQCTAADEEVAAGLAADPIHCFWASDPAWSAPANGAKVSSWRNRGSNGTAITEATDGFRPIYRSSVTGINSRPGVDFESSNLHRLYMDIADQSQVCTIVLIVVPQVSVDAATSMWAFTTTPTSRRIGLSTSGTGAWQYGAITPAGTPLVDTGFVLRAEFNNTSSILYVNEVNTMQGTVADAVAHISLGAFWNGSAFSQHYDGVIAYAALYAGSLTGDSDWEADLAFYKQFYGFTF